LFSSNPPITQQTSPLTDLTPDLIIIAIVLSPKLLKILSNNESLYKLMNLIPHSLISPQPLKQQQQQ
jgi:hypothetical protein